MAREELHLKEAESRAKEADGVKASAHKVPKP